MHTDMAKFQMRVRKHSKGDNFAFDNLIAVYLTAPSRGTYAAQGRV